MQGGRRLSAALSILQPRKPDESGMMKSKAIFIVILIISLSSRVKAEDPVFFTDLYLKYAVENVLLILDPTPTDMLGLTFLDANSSDIYHLGGLEHAENLTYLNVGYNWLTDISPISGLVNLKQLYLENNFISDISGLSGLTNLELLSLGDNNISDISALGPLTNLSTLWLYNNQVNNISSMITLANLAELDLEGNLISDIPALGILTGLEYLWLYNNQINNIVVLAPLVNLIELDLGANQISDISAIALFTHLDLLDLDQNQLNTPAYCNYLPMIQANNPLATEFLYDPNPNPFTNDCSTDMTELEQWSSCWPDTGCSPANNWCSGADLDHINDVGMDDFARFAQLWLREHQ